MPARGRVFDGVAHEVGERALYARAIDRNCGRLALALQSKRDAVALGQRSQGGNDIARDLLNRKRRLRERRDTSVGAGQLEEVVEHAVEASVSCRIEA